MKKTLSLLLSLILLLIPALPSSGLSGGVGTNEAFGMDIRGFNTFDLYGHPVNSSILSNADVTVINYWATWSNYSIDLLAKLDRLHRHYSSMSDPRVQIIGVICQYGDCTPASARAFLESHGYNWPNLMADNILASAFATSGYIPQTLIVDSNGVIRDHVIGGFEDYSSLLSYVERWRGVLSEHMGDTCTVRYVRSFDGMVFHTENVEYGTVLPAVSAPDFPGTVFTGFTYDQNILESGSDEPVYIAMGSAVITAQYETSGLRVRFFDYNGVLLDTQYVGFGESASAPEPPVHSGLTFTGWSVDFSCITEDTDVFAQYEVANVIHTGIPGDVNGDSRVTVADAILILRMAMGIFPVFNADLADLNGNGSIDISDAIRALRIAVGNRAL